MFTLFIGSLVGAGLVLLFKMIRDSENRLEHYHNALDIEQKIEKERNKVLLQQF
jgi:hypothetical protein